METLGERLRALRAEKDITQAQLAGSIFVSESYIALIESGKRNPSTAIVAKLSDFFGISADYLLYGDISEDDRLRVREWRNLVAGRSEKEIDSALNVARMFLDSIDKTKQ